MKKDRRATPANEIMPMAYHTYIASTAEAEKRKSPMGFLYLFVAMARRASEDKSKLRVTDLLRKK
jgi:hypothetical protein